MTIRQDNALADMVRAYPIENTSIMAPLAAPDRAGRASPLNRLRRFRGVPSTGARAKAVAALLKELSCAANLIIAAQVLLGMAGVYLVIFAVGAVG